MRASSAFIKTKNTSALVLDLRRIRFLGQSAGRAAAAGLDLFASLFATGLDSELPL